MLITEHYRALNRQLHHEDAAYGISGARYADIVSRVADKIGSRDILDYGCGKRTLERDLKHKVANYDPAVSGFEALPQPADIVVCTDVLEHIEPDLLDGVLAHLVRLTKREIVISVGLGPALKHLADGRNAHLIQESPDWWLARFNGLFRLQRSFQFGASNLMFIGQSLADSNQTPDLSDIGPPATVKTIITKSAYTDEQRMRNIRSAMLRCLPTVKVLPAHNKTMVLACYGPSLIDTMDELAADDGDIYTVSGAHDALLAAGIVPVGHIESDPRPHKAALVTPDERVCYFLSSACDRAVFAKLRGFETWLFHVTSSTPETNLIAQLDPHTFTVDGGTNVGMSAIGLGTVLGYRRFSIHGMDCSFKVNPELLYWPNDKDMPAEIRDQVRFHAGVHPNEDQPLYRVWVDGKPFISSPQMFQGAQDFMLMKTTQKHVRFELHGGGFLRALSGHIGTIRKAA